MTRFIFFLLFLFSFNLNEQNKFVDVRDSLTYDVFELGDLYWFKTNLNYKTPTSWCSENPGSKACKYGNYYYPTDLISVCPSGWRVPTWKDYKIAIKEIELHYGLSDSVEIHSSTIPLYKNLALEAERIVNLTLLGDTTFFDMASTGWIEGDEWVPQKSTTQWIIHDISNTPQPHVHISQNDLIMHSHGHNVLDKPKKLRRFAVRCVADEF